jgi:exodeoxyribonuclease V alpha subunit
MSIQLSPSELHGIAVAEPNFETVVSGIPTVEPDTQSILHAWSENGWLRRLDSAMAAFMGELDPTATPTLLVSTAVLVQMEGRGHTCLRLDLLALQPDEVLAWPQEAQQERMALWSTLPATLAHWVAALRESPLVRTVNLEPTDASDPDCGQPLVLSSTASQPLLYLRRYWLHERQVASEVLQRTAASQPVDEVVARQWLDRLFDAPANEASVGADVDWQKLACAVALRASLTVITGGPGTGKTYTAARLLALLFAIDANPKRLRVALAAPTGKAAARLRQSIDASMQELSQRLGATLDLEAFTKRIGAARTLHSLLGARPDTRQFRFNASNLLDVDILIVDEASMIHLEMMSALLQAMPAGAKLILLGDKDQLASVEAGAVLGDLCRDVVRGHYDQETARYVKSTSGQILSPDFLSNGSASTPLAQQTVMLRKSRRFGGLIGQLATAVNSGNSAAAQELITSDASGVLRATANPNVTSVLELAVRGRPGATACYADYLRLVSAPPAGATTDVSTHDLWVKSVLVAFDRFRILCAVHEGDWGTRSLNQTVQRALADAGLFKPKGEWFAGRPVMVTRNDPQLGVFNGDVGVALPSARGVSALRVYFLDGDSLRSVGVSRLAHVETAFAMTVHKCQGSEFLHTVLVLPQGGAKVLTRELVYTGITRARESFTLIEGQEGLLGKAIGQQSQRASGMASEIESGQ